MDYDGTLDLRIFSAGLEPSVSPEALHLQVEEALIQLVHEVAWCILGPFSSSYVLTFQLMYVL